MSDEEIRSLLRGGGLRSTRGRMELLAALRGARRPLTQAEIVARLRGRRLDRVSVYRALEALAGAGIVHRAYVSGRTWAFETAERCGADRCHPHFTCRKCGTVSCMTGTVAPLVRRLPKGYVIERQKVHIDGVCPGCAQPEVRGTHG